MIQKVDYLLEGGRAGVLLIHGLTGTPNEMRWVGDGLKRAGFTVHGMQLAGHCGTEDDLLATDWHDWYGSVCDAADALRGKVDHLFVAGLSMGAILALKLAADRPQQVDGLGIYGVSFVYDGWSIPRLSQWLSRLLPIAKPLGIGRKRRFMEMPPYGIKDDRIRKFIFMKMSEGDSAAAGLIGNPWHSLADMYQLSGLVQRELPRVQAPCLIMHAADDDIASVKNARLVMNNVSARSELVLLEDSYHMITVDRERDVVITRSAAFFNAIIADKTQAA
jgi:carboxylesterase